MYVNTYLGQEKCQKIVIFYLFSISGSLDQIEGMTKTQKKTKIVFPITNQGYDYKLRYSFNYRIANYIS